MGVETCARTGRARLACSPSASRRGAAEHPRVCKDGDYTDGAMHMYRPRLAGTQRLAAVRNPAMKCAWAKIRHGNDAAPTDIVLDR